MTILDFRRDVLAIEVHNAFLCSDLDWPDFCRQYEIEEWISTDVPAENGFRVRKKPNEVDDKVKLDIQAEYDKAMKSLRGEK